jgi:hypothetical protein
MLRASASAFGYDLDLRSVADPSIPTGIPGGNELLRFVDAVLGGGDADAARTAVVDALDGPSLFDAATVLGNFEMMNRVAEGSGIPIPRQSIDRNAETIEMLGIGRFVKG